MSNLFNRPVFKDRPSFKEGEIERDGVGWGLRDRDLPGSLFCRSLGLHFRLEVAGSAGTLLLNPLGVLRVFPLGCRIAGNRSCNPTGFRCPLGVWHHQRDDLRKRWEQAVHTGMRLHIGACFRQGVPHNGGGVGGGGYVSDRNPPPPPPLRTSQPTPTVNNEEQPICVPAAYRTLCLAPVDRGSEFPPHFPPSPLHFPASPPFVANGKRGCCPPDLCTFKNAPNEMGNSKNARQNPKKKSTPRGMCVRLVDVTLLLKHVPFCVVCFFDAATSGPLSAPCHTRCGPNTHSHGYPVRGNVEGSTGVACIAQPSQEQRRNTTRFEKRYKLEGEVERGRGAVGALLWHSCGRNCLGRSSGVSYWNWCCPQKFCMVIFFVLCLPVFVRSVFSV